MGDPRPLKIHTDSVQHDTTWLSEQKRKIAQYRVLVSNGGKDENVIGTWNGVREAVKDPIHLVLLRHAFRLDYRSKFQGLFPIGKSPIETTK